MPYRHEISDQDWLRIKDILPAENTDEGRPSKPNRDMLNGDAMDFKNRLSLVGFAGTLWCVANRVF